MRTYAAFLRGVMPTNAKMSELRTAFEQAGFGQVRTVLGSGNVVFTANAIAETTLERRAEAAMTKHLGRCFPARIRSIDDLRALLESDPFAGIRLKPEAKRIVTFLREAPAKRVALPIEGDLARIVSRRGREVFSFYLLNPRGPVFMTLIEKTFGKDVTTRTWETVEKVAR